MKKMQGFSVLCVMLPAFCWSCLSSAAVVPVCVVLRADRSLHRAGLLNNFRVAQESYLYEIIPEPTRLGLDQLTISTSEQLTEKELMGLKARLNDPKKLIILDLRSDMHGFVNGEPVQFHFGPSTKRSFDNELLLSEQIRRCDTMYLTDRHVRDMSSNGMLMDVENVNIEPNLVRSLGYEYERMPLDGAKKIDASFIDAFVSFIDTKVPETWIHIHDTDGLMATSLLFVMSDMLKNAHQVSYKDILMRHVAFGGIDFAQKRYDDNQGRFLRAFYTFAREHAINPMLTWSEWLKK